ncbi:type II secretion system protein N [Noviherbaspirillum aerium]|uniref:type II secretion system protein N n=1 Tax=Noviherbaspirillum aerium TaxID=2588497 RepID=UPI00178C607F|nr:type II secretion system protein N [Noviherbaspirillum aerium]
MKRLPLAISFVLFILLCASIAYWGLQMFKPPLRPVAAPPRAAPPEVRPESATALFGGRAAPVAAASNYQLRGVIFSGSARDSVAIISADGKPPQAIRVDREVVPGVTVKEVHPGYVILSENGASKRLELPETGRDAGITSPAAAPRPATQPMPPGRGMMGNRSQGASMPGAGNVPAATPPNPPAAPAAPPPTAQPAPPVFIPQQPAAAPPAATGNQPPVVPQPAVTNAPPTVVVTPPAQAGSTGIAQPATPPGALTPAPQPVVPGSIGSSGTSTVPGAPPLQSR